MEPWCLDVITSIKHGCFRKPETQFSLTLFRVYPGSGNWFIKSQLRLVMANLFTMRNLTSGQLEGLCQLLIANFSIWQGFQKVALRPWMTRMVHLKQLWNSSVWSLDSRDTVPSSCSSFSSSSLMTLLLGIKGLIYGLGSKTWSMCSKGHIWFAWEAKGKWFRKEQKYNQKALEKNSPRYNWG